MASKVQRRTLYQRTNMLRTGVHRIATQDSPYIQHYELARFKNLLKQTEQLANLARHLNPHDVVWERGMYEKYMFDVRYEVKEETRRVPVKEQRLSRKISGTLLSAVSMILGSVSRTRANIPGLQIMAKRLLYGERKFPSSVALSKEDALGQREVMADLIEEHGFEGEANILRANRSWRTVRGVLEDLGVTELPKTKPRTYSTSPSLYKTPYGWSARRDPRSSRASRLSSHRRRS